MNFHQQLIFSQEEIDTTLWGEMESESEEEESDEEEEEEEGEGDEAAADADGTQTPIVDAGLATPSGMSSVGMAAAMAGGETPELLELRKRRIEAEMEAGGETPNLYTVLPERGGQRVCNEQANVTRVLLRKLCNLL